MGSLTKSSVEQIAMYILDLNPCSEYQQMLRDAVDAHFKPQGVKLCFDIENPFDKTIGDDED